ncbi:adenosine deaminase/editase [Clavulina sp. PMI_390]|nr:adenosine deaminase/editase [Clavulina sp. PMI_390]
MVREDEIARACLNIWDRLMRSGAFKFLKPSFYTICAGIVFALEPLTDHGTQISPLIECVSIGAGSKCLPQSSLSSLKGDAIHDSHAEILARRAFVVWLISEMSQMYSQPDYQSLWLLGSDDVKRVSLKPGVSVHLYVSTLPCGDASTWMLALDQDPTMAALKDSTPKMTPQPGTTIRGRDNYSAFGALRTKPGRADSSPSASMSCSDKIASWTYLGLQGALLSPLLEPIYLDTIVIGGQLPELRDQLRTECERAFSSRSVSQAPIMGSHSFHIPCVAFTDLVFSHGSGASMCAESVSWNAHGKVDVLVNGRLRGQSSKSRSTTRPACSRASLLTQLQPLRNLAGLEAVDTWQRGKASATDYRTARDWLRSPQGPFWGWVESAEDRDW